MNKKIKFLTALIIFTVFAFPAFSSEINCNYVLSDSNPGNADENFKRAYCSIKKENYGLAKKYIGKVGQGLTILKDYVDYYRALSEYETGNEESAISILEGAVNSHRDSSLYKEMLILLARIHADEKNYETAINIYNKLFDSEESDWLKAKNLKAIGEIYEEQGKIKKAISVFHRIWVEYPNTSFSEYVFELAKKNNLVFKPVNSDYLKRGNYYFDKNLYSLALPELYKADKDAGVTKKIGICHYKLGNYNESVENLSKVTSAESSYWLALAKKRQGYDIEAAQKLSAIYRNFPNSEFASKGLLKSGAIFSDNLDNSGAKKSYKILLSNYPYSKEASEASWKLGWIYFKDKDYKKALSIFEQSSYPEDSFNTHLFKYWSAKSYEKLGEKSKASSIYRYLASSPRFTYHSFLAKIKIDDEFKSNNKKPLNFSGAFKDDIERKKAEKLTDLGIYDLARNEIKILEDKSKTVKENYYISDFYYTTGDYYSSIKFADKDFDPVSSNLSFPKGYEKYVKKCSNKYGLDEFLIYSLIREESRFNRMAVSVSNARGLMQLIPPTARETARKVGITNFNLQKLFVPEINIDLGCYYVNLVMSRFKGNIPLALAGYNAGPNRAAVWYDEMGHLAIDEFIEEIPFNETNFYVKRILRSYGAYKSLYSN